MGLRTLITKLKSHIDIRCNEEAYRLANEAISLDCPFPTDTYSVGAHSTLGAHAWPTCTVTSTTITPPNLRNAVKNILDKIEISRLISPRTKHGKYISEGMSMGLDYSLIPKITDFLTRRTTLEFLWGVYNARLKGGFTPNAFSCRRCGGYLSIGHLAGNGPSITTTSYTKPQPMAIPRKKSSRLF
jgi:hypothetical protein